MWGHAKESFDNEFVAPNNKFITTCSSIIRHHLIVSSWSSDDDILQGGDDDEHPRSNGEGRGKCSQLQGSMPGRIIVTRNRTKDHVTSATTTSKPPIYHEDFFQRRYRMCKLLFLRIMKVVKDYDSYCTLMKDCTEHCPSLLSRNVCSNAREHMH